MARVGSLPPHSLSKLGGPKEGVPAKILPHMATLVIHVCPLDTQTKPRLPWRGPGGGGGGATNWLRPNAWHFRAGGGGGGLPQTRLRGVVSRRRDEFTRMEHC